MTCLPSFVSFGALKHEYQHSRFEFSRSRIKNNFVFFLRILPIFMFILIPFIWCFVSPSFLIRFTPNLEHWFIYSWSILPMIYIVENYTINLVWHILHRWLEINIPPVSFIWFLRNLKPRNYIIILINTKSLKFSSSSYGHSMCLHFD